MALKNVFSISTGTKRVLFVVILITLGMILFSFNYYRGINRSIDPRVVEGKKAFGAYGKLMAEDNQDEALKVLDEIEAVYKSVPGYENSFELGVVNVNKGHIYLVKVETEHLRETKTIVKENLALFLKFAKEYTVKGIANYKNWIETTGKLNDAEIKGYLNKYFKRDDPAFKGYDFDTIFDKRFKEIKEAQIEINRRLSVGYTNLGVILRYEEKPLKSKEHYEKALKLWPENPYAENNLRILHGQKIKKRTIVEQMFPKERIEEAKANMKK